MTCLRESARRSVQGDGGSGSDQRALGQGHAARRQCAEQAGLEHASGDDEPKLYDEAGSVVAGFVLMGEKLSWPAGPGGNSSVFASYKF